MRLWLRRRRHRPPRNWLRLRGRGRLRSGDGSRRRKRGGLGDGGRRVPRAEPVGGFADVLGLDPTAALLQRGVGEPHEAQLCRLGWGVVVIEATRREYPCSGDLFPLPVVSSRRLRWRSSRGRGRGGVRVRDLEAKLLRTGLQFREGLFPSPSLPTVRHLLGLRRSPQVPLVQEALPPHAEDAFHRGPLLAPINICGAVRRRACGRG